MRERPSSSDSITSAPSSRRNCDNGAFAAAEAACKTDAQHRLYSSPHSGGTNRVGHQHGDGQRAYAAGDGSVCAGEFECLGMHVSDDGRSAPGECGLTLCIPSEEAVKLFASREAIDADINDGRSRLDHLWCDEARASDCGDEDVGFAGDSAKVTRLRVADGDGGVFVEQQHGHRLADDIASTHD